jgi:hypothetical protein
MTVIDMRGGSEKTVAADLALKTAVRQVGMGLAAGDAFNAGKFDPVAHGQASTPRRI